MGLFSWLFGGNKPEAIRSADGKIHQVEQDNAVGGNEPKAIRSAVLAVDFDLPTMERMLQRWPNLSKTIYSPGHTLLHDVAQYARIRGSARAQLAVRLLLESGADINAQDWEGKTALAILCQDNFRELETAALLVSSGANPNILDCKGVAAFHWIVARVHDCQFVELMIRHGANVNLACGNNADNPFYVPGARPLRLASDRPEIVKLLIKHGANCQA